MEKRSGSELVPARFEKIHHLNIHINYVGFFSLHEHDCLEVVIVLRGKGIYRCEYGQIPIGPGDITLRNFYEPHELVANEGEPLSTLCIQVSASFCRDYFPKLRNLRFDTDAISRLPREDLRYIHDLAMDAAQDFFEEKKGYQLSCVGKISILLSFLINRLPHTTIQSEELMNKRSKGDRKRRLISYINQHYREKMSLESLAATENVTPTHLSHFFRENFEMSFREYLNKVRMERALILLQDPNLYLVDICMETGFSDSRYLNSVFEKTFGLSVAEYRDRYQNPENDLQPMKTVRAVSGGRYSHTESIQIIREHRAQGGFRY